MEHTIWNIHLLEYFKNFNDQGVGDLLALGLPYKNNVLMYNCVYIYMEKGRGNASESKYSIFLALVTLTLGTKCTHNERWEGVLVALRKAWTKERGQLWKTKFSQSTLRFMVKENGDTFPKEQVRCIYTYAVSRIIGNL